MRYIFSVGEITYPTGLRKKYPTIRIVDSDKYGDFFNAEISNLATNLPYVIEIVDILESLLQGKREFYEGFGFEAYMIECDREKALVKNIFEDDRVEAVIPTAEVYQLMRDYLIQYYQK